jgi:hypothetical protein
MTVLETIRAIKAAGMSCRFNDGEIRVTFPASVMPDAQRREDVAYYTTDRADAVDTARSMALDAHVAAILTRPA